MHQHVDDESQEEILNYLLDSGPADAGRIADGYDLLQNFHSYGVHASFTQHLGARIVVSYNGRDANIWIIGASDERALSFFNVAWGRLSVSGAKLWATYNPEAPQHWFKRNVLDRAEDFDGEEVPFLMRDNPSLPDEVIERYERSFVGHFYQRMIAGKWVGASGLIFPTWHKVETPMENGRPVFALDWGVATVFHALFIRSRGQRADITAELCFDARDSQPRTEQEHADAFISWATECAGDLTGLTVWMDPSTPSSFKRILRKRGLVPGATDNSVIDGLVTTSARLASGDVLIGDCPMLINEMLGYQWDAKAANMGEDKPTKRDDHGCDALRYYTHSTGKAFRMSAMQPVSKIFMQ